MTAASTLSGFLFRQGIHQSESAYACAANQRPRSWTDQIGPECALYKRGWQMREADLYSTSTREHFIDAQVWPENIYDTQPIHISHTSRRGQRELPPGLERPHPQQHRLRRRGGLRAAVAASLVLFYRMKYIARTLTLLYPLIP